MLEIFSDKKFWAMVETFYLLFTMYYVVIAR